MKRILVSSLIAASMLVSGQLFAEGKEEKKEAKPKEAPTGHCEKSDANGKVEDIEAKDKADCKTKGGKWNKKAKDEHSHDHKDEDKHK